MDTGYIYCYTNKHDGRKYIGKTMHLHQRRRKHYWNRLLGRTYFQRAMRKYGEDGFRFEVLYLCSEDVLNWWETYFITTFRFLGLELYNMTDGGEGCLHMSQEHREKIGQANRGKVLTEEHKRRISQNRTGIYHTEETKQLLREKSSGRIASEETRKKLSEAGSKRKQTEATKQKLSEQRKGKWIISEEQKEKIRTTMTGRTLSEEHKAKIRAATQSEEYRKRRSEQTASKEIQDKIRQTKEQKGKT